VAERPNESVSKADLAFMLTGVESLLFRYKVSAYHKYRRLEMFLTIGPKFLSNFSFIAKKTNHYGSKLFSKFSKKIDPKIVKKLTTPPDLDFSKLKDLKKNKIESTSSFYDPLKDLQTENFSENSEKNFLLQQKIALFHIELQRINLLFDEIVQINKKAKN
jgi:hypothetical protein